VGSTTLAPGETTNLDVSIQMGQGMGGMHLFEVTVISNDPGSTNNKVTVRVDFME
jgi:hypothetical protein